MRVGEICALKWEDISFQEKSIYVHKTMQRLQIPESTSQKTHITVTSPKRGLFEWDDMIHNALGCMLGCWVMNWIFVKLKNCKWNGDSQLLAVPFYLLVDGAVDEGGCTFAMISRVFFYHFMALRQQTDFYFPEFCIILLICSFFSFCVAVIVLFLFFGHFPETSLFCFFSGLSIA